MIGLGDTLLRAVPDAARQGLANGDLALFGSVIRSAKTGKIAYHLQETGALRKLASTALTPGVLPLEAAKLASQTLGDAVLYRQGEQIKAAVSQVARTQLTNLFVSGATLGVSVAGFAYLANRIAKIDRQVSEMHRHLSAVKVSLDALLQDRVRDDLSMLRTMGQQLDESWQLRNPSNQLERVASECHILANRFFERSYHLLSNDGATLSLSEPLLEAFGIAQSTRMAARLYCDEYDAAKVASSEALEQYNALLERANPAPELLSKLRAEASGDYFRVGAELETTMSRPRLVAQAVRDRAEAIESVSHLVKTLGAKGILGRELGALARQELDAPFLLLEAER